MKKIRIKITDTDKNNQSISCFGEKNYRDFLDMLLELLKENYDVEFSDNPEYVFSILPVGMAKGYEYFAYKDKVQCQIILENVRPDFNCFDYAIGSFHNISYADRYLFLPAALMSTNQPRSAYSKVLEKHLDIRDSMAKRRFCSFVVSNGDNAAVERENFFHLLSKYKQVDSGGRFLNNVGGPVEDRVKFEKQYKFSIVFENAWQSEITEKLDMAFAAKTVPIYWGNTYVKDVYNSDAFIDCNDYENFRAVVDEVIRLDNDDNAYLKCLRTPAYRNSVSEADYMKSLEDFLVNMIETPYEKAIIRTGTYWSNKLQRMRYEAFKSNYKKLKTKRVLAKIVKRILGPLTNSKAAIKIKRYLNSRV